MINDMARISATDSRLVYQHRGGGPHPHSAVRQQQQHQYDSK